MPPSPHGQSLLPDPPVKADPIKLKNRVVDVIEIVKVAEIVVPAAHDEEGGGRGDDGGVGHGVGQVRPGGPSARGQVIVVAELIRVDGVKVLETKQIVK